MFQGLSKIIHIVHYEVVLILFRVQLNTSWAFAKISSSLERLSEFVFKAIFLFFAESKIVENPLKNKDKKVFKYILLFQILPLVLY